ncbi:MAG: helix-turn-helix transcriptional regulator [Aerococcaceae bacterium]|nr:helix-turn-helix transcriptional regulator [Aerococcaceae bacterium]
MKLTRDFIHDKHSIGRRIQLIRKEKGLTTKEFGRIIDNASDSNVSRWEKGKALPNNKRLMLIAHLGNISVEELLYGKGTIEIFSSLSDEIENILNYTPVENINTLVVSSRNSLTNIYNDFVNYSDEEWLNKRQEITEDIHSVIEALFLAFEEDITHSN